MKKFTLLFLSLFFIKTTKAQMPEIKIVQPQSLQKNFPQAKLLYNSDKGKVYALPLDNMKCLVPYEMYTINNIKYYKQTIPNNFIPNAFPNYDIIPHNPDIKILNVTPQPPKIYK